MGNVGPERCSLDGFKEPFAGTGGAIIKYRDVSDAATFLDGSLRVPNVCHENSLLVG